MRNRYFNLPSSSLNGVVVFTDGREPGLRWFQDVFKGVYRWELSQMKELGATEITRSESRRILGYPIY